MKIGELKKRYKDEWVLVEVLAEDELLHIDPSHKDWTIGYTVEDVEEYLLKRAAERYKEGKISIEEAVVGVKRALKNPLSVLSDIEGFKNVLELSKESGVKNTIKYKISDEGLKIRMEYIERIGNILVGDGAVKGDTT